MGSSGNSVGTRGNSVGTQWELSGNVVGVYTERVRSMYGVDRVMSRPKIATQIRISNYE